MKDIRAELMQILGDNLSTIRKAKGFSRRQLADYLKVDVNTIGAYENAKKLPPLDKIFELANFLEVSVVDLIGANLRGIIDKNLFEYRIKHALELTEFDFLSPPIQHTNGKITVSIPAKFKVNDDGAISFYADEDGAVMHNITFRDAEVFVSTVEKAEKTAAIKFVPFVEELKNLVSEILKSK
ncbi:MAG: helix-turn-helix transcriptional regulator [Selenomonadaceae bacterium]|nr:helix-turn-helix transcriptional regulator [Selenomonadaceae bacterium]